MGMSDFYISVSLSYEMPFNELDNNTITYPTVV